MKKLFAMLLTLAMVFALVACNDSEPTPSADPSTVPSVEPSVEPTPAGPELIATIITALEGDGGMNNIPVDVTSEENAKYFGEGGVAAVLAAGQFYINDFAIPGTEDACTTEYPDGYTINGEVLFSKGDEGWAVGRDTFATYAEATAAAITDMPAGLETQLFDSDGDGKADIVKLWYKEGVVVNELTKTDAGYTVFRGDLKETPAYAGRLFDADAFGADSDVVIKAENFDTTIEEGDVALFWCTPDGWVMQRAEEINGILVDGEDHHYYQIDETQYPDAMKFSRDNLITAQRNGEFTNAHKYFGLMKNTEGLKISLWLAPESKAPVGLTSNENAKTFLQKAVDAAQAKLDGVTLAADATEDQKFAYAALEDALKVAKNVLADEDATASQCDFHVYYLYLTLHGTGDDIGAAFAKFYVIDGKYDWKGDAAYKGFDTYFNLVTK